MIPLTDEQWDKIKKELLKIAVKARAQFRLIYHNGQVSTSQKLHPSDFDEILSDKGVKYIEITSKTFNITIQV